MTTDLGHRQPQIHDFNDVADGQTKVSSGATDFEVNANARLNADIAADTLQDSSLGMAATASTAALKVDASRNGTGDDGGTGESIMVDDRRGISPPTSGTPKAAELPDAAVEHTGQIVKNIDDAAVAAAFVRTERKPSDCENCPQQQQQVETVPSDNSRNGHASIAGAEVTERRRGTTTTTATIIRPNPVKVAAATGATATHLVAPLQPTRISENSLSLSPSSSIASPRVVPKDSLPDKDQPSRATAAASESRGDSSTGGDNNKPWCKQATDRQALERKAKAEKQRQQIQCDFPESDNSSVMPPTNGRPAAEADMDGAAKNTAAHADERSLRSERHRQFSSGVSSNGGNMGTRALQEDVDVVDDGQKGKQPAPLFERLVTEEVQELKTYVRIIESQHRRLSELELVHGDLEVRLQTESRARQHLEATLEAREREWKNKFAELKSDRDQWKEVVKVEQTKNARLIDQVVRKDQDIHRMLQRKVRPLDVVYSATQHADSHSTSATTVRPRRQSLCSKHTAANCRSG